MNDIGYNNSKTGRSPVTFRFAVNADLPKMLKLRMDYLAMEQGVLSEPIKMAINTQLEQYLPKHFGIDLFCFLAEVDGKTAGTAWLIIQEKPANPHFITGKIGIVVNVLTYPEFRQRGVASGLLRRIIDFGKAQNLSNIELSATVMGRPLYEKYGFVAGDSAYTAMKLELNTTRSE